MNTPLLFGLTGEQLVQFANIGCGAICVLGVVISGFMIFTLSQDAPPAKAGLIKSFMKYCVVLALVSGCSSSALAWQNAGKVHTAEAKTQETKATAQALLATAEESKTALLKTKQDFAKLTQQMPALTTQPAANQSNLKLILERSKELDARFQHLDKNLETARQSLER